MIADTIRNEYYYDESAGIRQCLTKVMGVANKRLAHQRDRYGMGHSGDDGGPIGVAVAVVRGRELYVATVGPAEAYLIRQARLSTLPDPNRDRGLPVDELEPEVWRGELSVGDSLCLVSANIVAKIGTDALKDALVTLHPQSAIEHLHARFVAADGKGSDGALAFEANEVGATHKAKTLVPVRPAEPLAGAPDKSPIPLADTVTASAAAIGRRRDQGARARPATGSSARSGGSRTCSRAASRRRARSPAPRRGWRCSGGRPSPCSRSSPSAGALVFGVYAVGGAAPAAGRDPVAHGRQERVRDRPGGPGQRQRAGRRPHHRRPAPGAGAAELGLPAARRRREGGLPAGADRPAARRRALAGLDRLYGVTKVKSSPLFTFPKDKPVELDGARPRVRRRAVRARHRQQDRVADRPRQEDGDADPQVRASGRRARGSPTPS